MTLPRPTGTAGRYCCAPIHCHCCRPSDGCRARAMGDRRRARRQNACKARDVTNEERLAGCTAMIEAKTETGRSLAVAYCNRGFALTEKRELDSALADLDRRSRSIRRMPARSATAAACTRSRATSSGRWPTTTEAIKLDPKFAARLQQPRRRADAARRTRQGDRGFHHRDQARPEDVRSPTATAAGPISASANTTRAIADYGKTDRARAGRPARATSTAATSIAR